MTTESQEEITDLRAQLAQEIADLRAQVEDANRCASQALKDRDLLRDQYYQWERLARENTDAPDKVQAWQRMAQGATAEAREYEETAKYWKRRAESSRANLIKYKNEIALLKAQLELVKAQALVSKLKQK